MFTEVNFSNLKSKALADYVTSLFIVTSSKLANWRQSSWNNILFDPVDTSIDILKKRCIEAVMGQCISHNCRGYF